MSTPPSLAPECRDVHDPEYWHAELRPLLVELDLALQSAVPKAHDVFVSHLKKPVNRPLLSNLVRYFVLEYLKAANIDARDLEEDEGWALKNLSNNGIEILYRGSCIRFRKSMDPPAPSTEAGKNFYQQVLSQEFGTVVINILILWNLNSSLQYVGEMYIVRLIRVRGRKVKYEWRKAVDLSVINISEPVEPEYVLPADLPIGNADEPERDQPGDEERERGTGTDAD
jgi:hypothetical protein